MNELEKQLSLANSRSARIKKARDEAERLLEHKSRELYQANKELELVQKGLEDDIKQATYELSVSNQRLQTSLNERSAFIGQMSHEVRTPLNAIMGLSEILLTTQLDDTQNDYLNTINSAAGSLVVLLNDMLDITKIEAGKLEIHLEPVLIRRVHQNVVSMFEIEAEKKGLSLQLYISPDVPEHVNIDKGRYKQIVTNLISNAIKNTELGFITVSVSYDTAAFSAGIGALHVQIVDTGVGIPADHVKRIFNAYEQLGVDSQGVGLGLAICKQLCELMHGDIKCISEVGQGSTFELTIPAEAITSVDEGHSVEAAEGVLSNRELSILVAEDNVTNQKVLTAQLAQLGQKATIVNNGAEAIKCLNNHRYDVVLLDILMPVLDGEQTLRAIRAAKPEIATQYCIALTASNYQDQRQRLLSKGFDDFLSKPLSIADLEIALKKAVKKTNRNLSDSLSRDSGDLQYDNGFDMAYLRSQFGEACDAIFMDIAPTFLQHTDGEVAQLSEAISNDNVDAIIKHSHSIKGGASSMGLIELAERLETLEHNPSSSRVNDWFGEIKCQWANVEHQIKLTLRHLKDDE